MMNNRINKVTAQGDNIFVFQYIDSHGSPVEEKKSFESFLDPFIQPLREQIDQLKQSLSDKGKIEDLLDAKALQLGEQLAAAEQEKDRLEKQLAQFLSEIEGKDLSQTNDLYQGAFDLFSKGNVEEALAALDEAAMKAEEKKAEALMQQMAETRLLKARMLNLKNDHEEAGQHYERAVELWESWNNCKEAGDYFLFVNEFKKARHYFERSLKLAATDIQQAETMNQLGCLHKDTNNLAPAGEYYQKVLAIYRQLAKTGSEQYLQRTSAVLHNLALLERLKGDFDKAEEYCREALAICRQLAAIGADDHLFHLAKALDLMGLIQYEKKAWDDAETLYREALQILRKVVTPDNNYNHSTLAMTLINLAIVEEYKALFDRADQHYTEALTIYGELAQSNPKTYLPLVAQSLNNIGLFQCNSGTPDQAFGYYQQSLEIRRKLAEGNPQKYLPQVAATLINLANYTRDFEKDEDQSLAYASEASTILQSFQSIPYAKEYLKKAKEVLEGVPNGWKRLKEI